MKNHVFRFVRLAAALAAALALASCGDGGGDGDDPRFVPVTGLSIDRTGFLLGYLVLGVGEQTPIRATASPADATHKTLLWSSENPSVATAGDDGIVTGVSSGYTVIRVRAVHDGTTTASAALEVHVVVKAASLVLDKAELTLGFDYRLGPIGETEVLVAAVHPMGADVSLIWRAEGPVTVRVNRVPNLDALDEPWDPNGRCAIVTSFNVGAATVMVEDVYSGAKATCEVTVVQRVRELAFDKLGLGLRPGQQGALSVTVLPEDAHDKRFAWSSSDPSVAAVTGDGLVTAVSVGRAKIIVTAEDKGQTAACPVTVLPHPVPGDVYVFGSEAEGGHEEDYIFDGIPIPVLWINGAAHYFDHFGYGAELVSGFLSDDGDAYAVGTIEGGVGLPWPYGGATVLWVNGAMQIVTKYYSKPNSVFVSGKDVYIAGRGPWEWTNGVAGYYPACIWKNGVAQNLSEKGSEAWSVFVSDGDVYVAGEEGTRWTAVLWENGAPRYLADGDWPAYAQSVFVSGGDVYVAGSRRRPLGEVVDSVSLWINGVEHILNGPDYPWGRARSVTVADGDVYVLGNEGDQSASYNTVWKNGEVLLRLNEYPLEDDSPHYYGCYVNSFFVSGDNVYAAGCFRDGWVQFPVIWENGEPSQVGVGASPRMDVQARSVFVAK
jgi:hypothetical protein